MKGVPVRATGAARWAAQHELFKYFHTLKWGAVRATVLHHQSPEGIVGIETRRAAG